MSRNTQALDFSTMARAADELLSVEVPAGVLANPALHPVRDHPGLRSASRRFGLRLKLLALIRILASWALQVFRALRPPSWKVLPRPLPPRTAGDVKSPVVVFVGHRLPGSCAGSPRDLYFGTLPASFRSFVLLVDHRPLIAQFAHRGGEGAGSMTVPFSFGPSVEMRLLVEAGKGVLWLMRRLWCEDDVVKRAVLRESLARSAEAIKGLRIAYAVGLACEGLQPDVLVVTFEGHPWERLAFRSAKVSVPGIVTVGYPHAGALPGQHSVFRSLGPGLDADGVLTPGEASRRTYARRLPDLPVEVIGSARRLSPEHDADASQSACLIVPEGRISEVKVLVEFALDLAPARPDIEFFVHLHPVVAQRSEIDGMLERLGRCANVRLADAEIERDLARAKWCIYRGSTLAVMAAAIGIEPIYLHREGEAVIDPLHELWPAEGAPVHAVRNVDEALARFTSEEKNQAAIQLAADYFTPPEPDALHRLVARVRAARM